VYGRRFLLVGIDEAQNLRNIKKSYWALFALRERSESIVAMTATPITNRPMVGEAPYSQHPALLTRSFL
jgi:hypothetical protein